MEYKLITTSTAQQGDHLFWDGEKIIWISPESIPYTYHHIDKINEEVNCPLCEMEYPKVSYKDIKNTVYLFNVDAEDHSKYPHKCTKCEGPAYIGLLACECPKCGKFNLN